MKLLLILKISLVAVLFVIYYGNGNNVFVCAETDALDIGRDRTNYIKAQIALRNQAINNQFDKFVSDVNGAFSGGDGDDALFGLTTMMNTLSGLFGVFDMGISCGLASALSASVLGMAQEFSSGSSDFGNLIANGVKNLIDESINKYDVNTLNAEFEGTQRLMKNFYIDKYETTISDINNHFITTMPKFEKFPQSVALYTLYANSHLLFLNDIVSRGQSNYNLTSSQVNNYVKKFEDAIKQYRMYIDSIETKSNKESGNRNQDEWNERNDYYNFMKLYVYDISNYWDFLHPINYPKGMLIENAHVSLSKLFGAPYKGDDHLSANEIDKYLDSNNVYQYQGKLKGIYYKNYYCVQDDQSELNLVKYFGGRQFFFRDNQERDTKFLGDEGSKAGPRQYVDLSGKSVESVVQYLSRDKSPKYFSRDYHWGIDVGTSRIGDITVYKTRTTVGYPEKSIASVLPISYNLCNVGCYNQPERSAYLVESAAVGFVNSDVIDENIVLELTGSMIDAQKYIYSPAGAVSYTRDGYKKYKHSMLFQPNKPVNYKITYNPYNKMAGKFKLQLDLRPYTTGNLVIQSSYSPSGSSWSSIINKSFYVSALNGQIYDLGTVTLNPSKTNYFSLSFSNRVYLSSLIFVPIS